MPVISRAQAVNYARAARFSGGSVDIIVAIAQAESGLNTGARNVNNDARKTVDRGILQINNYWHAEVSDGCAYDPACAFSEAYRISESGSKFTQWAAYTNGSYRKYLTGTQPDNPEAYAFPLPGWRGTIGLHWGEYPGAVDLFAPQTQLIVAMRGGKVENAGSNSLGGNTVFIRGTDGLVYYYAHMKNAPLVRTGQTVATGTPLGYVGKTGNAANTDPHLHLGIGHVINSGAGPTGGAGEPGFDAVGLVKSVYEGGGTGDPMPDPPGGNMSAVDAIREATLPGYVLIGSAGEVGPKGRRLDGDLLGGVGREPVYSPIDGVITGIWGNSLENYGIQIRSAGGINVRIHYMANHASGLKQWQTIQTGRQVGTVRAAGNTDANDPSILLIAWREGTALDTPSEVWSEGGTGGTGKGGGGGTSGFGDSHGVSSTFQDFSNQVHETLFQTPGIKGIALALDQAEQFPGVIWLVEGGLLDAAGNPASFAGDMFRSIFATISGNLMAFAIRLLCVFLGLVLLIGLIRNAIMSQIDEETIAKVAAMAI